MRISLFTVSLLLILLGCEKNDYVIPQDKMVDILVDIHLTDGMINNHIDNFMYNEAKYPAYQKIYEKFGVDEAQLDSSMVFYSDQAKLFVAIYDSVITRLMKIETDVQTGKYFQPDLFTVDTLLQNRFPQDSLLKDSIFKEFWNMQRDYTLPEYTSRGKIDFSFDIDTFYGFEYRLYAEMVLFPGDCSENPLLKMEVEYYDSTRSRVNKVLIKDSVSREYSLVLMLDSGKVPKILKGRLLDDDKCLGDKHAEVKNIRLYEIGDPKKAEELRFKGFINNHR